MNGISRIAQRHASLVIAAFILLTLFFGWSAQNITMTTDIKAFFPKDDPRVVTYEAVADEFGGTETVMIAVDADDLFGTTSLAALDRLTRHLEDVAGVSRVRSITNVDEIRGSDFGIEIAPVMATLPKSPQEAETFRDRVMSDPTYRGMLVAEDGGAALVIVELEADIVTGPVVSEVERVVSEYDGPGAVYMTGTPVLNKVLIDTMKADLIRLMPIVLLVIAAVLYVHFRSLYGVLLPFATVLISVVWTIGAMSLLNKPISPLSSVLPVILVSLGNAYAIYIVSRWRDAAAAGEGDAKAAVHTSLRSVGVAVIAAAGTTMAGFFSNTTSKIDLMRDFGLFTTLGIGVALLAALLFVPAVLTRLPLPRSADKTREDRGLLDRALAKTAAITRRRPGWVMGVGAVVVLLGIAGSYRISTDSNFFNFFDARSEPRIAYDLVKERFGGSESLEILIHGDMDDPDLLQRLSELQTELEMNPRLSHLSSPVNILERVDAALNPEKPRGELPKSSALAAQYYLLMEMDENNLLSSFVNLDYTSGRLQARATDTTAAGTNALIVEAEQSIERHLGSQNATLTGIVILFDALADLLVSSQLSSLLTSTLLVFVLVTLILRSLEGSSLSVFLIVLVALVNFGLMGWAGIALDIVTVLISSIGIGVGIDYAIHVYSAYTEELRRGYATDEALERAIRSRGRAIATNALAVIAGFLVLVTSSFPPLRYFGLLVTTTMLMAALGALLLLPAAIALKSRRSSGAHTQKG